MIEPMNDITLANFEADLINGSMQQPVLLDIWAPWCGPCKQLGPVLEKLEVAYAGRFKLAKLNSDDQPEIAAQLSQAFGVKSIPFCVMFKDGQPVDGFVGALPEAQIREFLDRHVPDGPPPDADDADEAEALGSDDSPDAALARLQQALAIDPANEAARCDVVKLLIETGQVAAARQAWRRWPARPSWTRALPRSACGWTPARKHPAHVRRRRWRRPLPPTGAILTPAMSWPKWRLPAAASPTRWTSCWRS